MPRTGRPVNAWSATEVLQEWAEYAPQSNYSPASALVVGECSQVRAPQAWMVVKQAVRVVQSVEGVLPQAFLDPPESLSDRGGGGGLVKAGECGVALGQCLLKYILFN